MVYLDFPERASSKQWCSGKHGSTSDTLLLPPPLNPAPWCSGASSLSPSLAPWVGTQREHKLTHSRSLVYLLDVVSALSLQAFCSLSLAVVQTGPRSRVELCSRCELADEVPLVRLGTVLNQHGGVVIVCLLLTRWANSKSFPTELHAGFGRRAQACVPASCASKWEESLSLMVALGRGHGGFFCGEPCGYRRCNLSRRLCDDSCVRDIILPPEPLEEEPL